MGIRLEDLGPAARAQAERQIADAKARRKALNLGPAPDAPESRLEADFYTREIWPMILSGEIVECEMHKTFLLLPAAEYGNAPSTEDKQYTATPLVDGLRLRPYPEADDSNCNEALTYLTKGKAYELVQTRDHWAYLLTEENAGGWACIDDADGTYLKITEV